MSFFNSQYKTKDEFVGMLNATNPDDWTYARLPGVNTARFDHVDGKTYCIMYHGTTIVDAWLTEDGGMEYEIEPWDSVTTRRRINTYCDVLYLYTRKGQQYADVQGKTYLVNGNFSLSFDRNGELTHCTCDQVRDPYSKMPPIERNFRRQLAAITRCEGARQGIISHNAPIDSTCPDVWLAFAALNMRYASRYYEEILARCGFPPVNTDIFTYR